MGDTGIKEWFESLPIVTKWLLVSTGSATLLSALGLLQVMYLAFIPFRIYNNFELWRIITPFVYLGPPSLPFLMSIVILVQYSPIVERDMFHSQVADYVWFLVVVGIPILLVAGLGMNQSFFALSLVFAIVYMYSRFNPTGRSSIWGFAFPTAYLPWALIGFNFLLGGFPLMQIVGVLAGHIYFYIKNVWPARGGYDFLQVPQFMYSLFPRQGRPTFTGFGGPSATTTNNNHNNNYPNNNNDNNNPRRRTFQGTGFVLGTN